VRSPNLGFTVIEVSFVAFLTVVGSSVAVIQLKNSVRTLDANTAAMTVTSQLRYARDIAVNQRRNVDVEFTETTIVVRRHETDDTLTVISTTSLPTGYEFGLPADMGDTPDGYGNDSAVSFNGGNTGTFLADGTFVNGSTGIVMSGTVFTIGSTIGSARAITLSGTTGRTKKYIIRGGAWVEAT